MANQDVKTDVLIVGGGPAGMMAGLLFARAGLKTIVLEKHNDFIRDFRGDTVHPSTLELFAELGLLEELLQLPHDKLSRISAMIKGQRFTVADFSHLPTTCGYIAMMPQWEFLNFVSRAAHRYPCFELKMNCEATDILKEGDRIVGIQTADHQQIKGSLVIAADGRNSVIRQATGLPLKDLGAPMDVFWFRVPKQRQPNNQTAGVFSPGRIIAMIDRGEYWQCGFVIAKGTAKIVQERGLDKFIEEIHLRAPVLGPGINTIKSWDDVKLLSVSLNRLLRWHCPGFLAIGDAAHAMSPIGGVGINLAIQDAVAAANILAAPMLDGENIDSLTAKVQERRMLPTMIIQEIQRFIQTRIISTTLQEKLKMEKVPLAIRLLNRFPILQRIPGRLVGLGFRREHIMSPKSLSDYKE